MQITPKIKKELKRILWDYSIDEKTLCEIWQGKRKTFSLSQKKLYARLLLSTSWYQLLNCLGVRGLKNILKDDVIALIWIKDIREKYIYAKKILHGLS